MLFKKMQDVASDEAENDLTGYEEIVLDSNYEGMATGEEGTEYKIKGVVKDGEETYWKSITASTKRIERLTVKLVFDETVTSELLKNLILVDGYIRPGRDGDPTYFSVYKADNWESSNPFVTAGDDYWFEGFETGADVLEFVRLEKANDTLLIHCKAAEGWNGGSGGEVGPDIPDEGPVAPD